MYEIVPTVLWRVTKSLLSSFFLLFPAFLSVVNFCLLLLFVLVFVVFCFSS